ncbi:hypothetical protein ACFL38_00505 [Candidatus Omnitrophota bacterium]
MITYNIAIIKKTLKEICEKFILTKTLVIKKLAFVVSEDSVEFYRVTFDDDTQHIVPKELMNQYIESLGDKAGLEIAGCLMHSIEQEESAYTGSSPETDDFWDGDVQDAIDYLNKKKGEDGFSKEDIDYHEGKEDKDKYF